MTLEIDGNKNKPMLGRNVACLSCHFLFCKGTKYVPSHYYCIQQMKNISVVWVHSRDNMSDPLSETILKKLLKVYGANINIAQPSSDVVSMKNKN